MIIESFTQKGTLHQEHGLANQDAVLTGQGQGYAWAVVCDGVSLKSDWTFSNSELASKICTKSACSYLEQTLKPGLSPQEITDVLHDAFQFTDTVLKQTLEQADIPLFDCQTTMIVMIYRKGRLYGGIAGDGGILFLTKDSRLSMMVTHFKTSSSVYPISDEDQWRFFMAGDPADPVVEALAATDGIFDFLIQVEDNQAAVNMEEIQKLFSISSIPYKRRSRWLKKTVEAIPGHDDKTIALIIDTQMKKPLH